MPALAVPPTNVPKASAMNSRPLTRILPTMLLVPLLSTALSNLRCRLAASACHSRGPPTPTLVVSFGFLARIFSTCSLRWASNSLCASLPKPCANASARAPNKVFSFSVPPARAATNVAAANSTEDHPAPAAALMADCTSLAALSRSLTVVGGLSYNLFILSADLTTLPQPATIAIMASSCFSSSSAGSRCCPALVLAAAEKFSFWHALYTSLLTAALLQPTTRATRLSRA